MIRDSSAGLNRRQLALYGAGLCGASYSISGGTVHVDDLSWITQDGVYVRETERQIYSIPDNKYGVLYGKHVYRGKLPADRATYNFVYSDSVSEVTEYDGVKLLFADTVAQTPYVSMPLSSLAAEWEPLPAYVPLRSTAWFRGQDFYLSRGVDSDSVNEIIRADYRYMMVGGSTTTAWDFESASALKHSLVNNPESTLLVFGQVPGVTEWITVHAVAHGGILQSHFSLTTTVGMTGHDSRYYTISELSSSNGAALVGATVGVAGVTSIESALAYVAGLTEVASFLHNGPIIVSKTWDRARYSDLEDAISENPGAEILVLGDPYTEYTVGTTIQPASGTVIRGIGNPKITFSGHSWIVFDAGIWVSGGAQTTAGSSLVSLPGGSFVNSNIKPGDYLRAGDGRGRVVSVIDNENLYGDLEHFAKTVGTSNNSDLMVYRMGASISSSILAGSTAIGGRTIGVQACHGLWLSKNECGEEKVMGPPAEPGGLYVADVRSDTDFLQIFLFDGTSWKKVNSIRADYWTHRHPYHGFCSIPSEGRVLVVTGISESLEVANRIDVHIQSMPDGKEWTYTDDLVDVQAGDMLALGCYAENTSSDKIFVFCALKRGSGHRLTFGTVSDGVITRWYAEDRPVIDIHGSGENNVWLTGFCSNDSGASPSTVMQFDGDSIVHHHLPGSYRYCILYSIWVASKTCVVTAGRLVTATSAYQGAVFVYDGSSWTDHSFGYDVAFHDTWASSVNNIYIVGRNRSTERGECKYYDGVEWSDITADLPDGPNGYIPVLHAIQGNESEAGIELFISGDEGYIAHFDGVSWERLPVGPFGSGDDVAAMFPGVSTPTYITEVERNFGSEGASFSPDPPGIVSVAKTGNPNAYGLGLFNISYNNTPGTFVSFFSIPGITPLDGWSSSYKNPVSTLVLHDNKINRGSHLETDKLAPLIQFGTEDSFSNDRSMAIVVDNHIFDRCKGFWTTSYSGEFYKDLGVINLDSENSIVGNNVITLGHSEGTPFGRGYALPHVIFGNTVKSLATQAYFFYAPGWYSGSKPRTNFRSVHFGNIVDTLVTDANGNINVKWNQNYPLHPWGVYEDPGRYASATDSIYYGTGITGNNADNYPVLDYRLDFLTFAKWNLWIRDGEFETGSSG